MTTPRNTTLVSVADLLSALSFHAKLSGPLRVPLDEAVGGILAEPLVVPFAVPAEPRALRPGYAVASRDLVGTNSYAPLAVSDEPRFVAAGAALPPGTDAVLPPDAVVKSGPLIEIVAGVAPGENVCRAGDDAPAGAVLRRPGERFRPGDVALARLAGLDGATIRRPRVRVVAAGDRNLTVDGVLRFAGIDGVTVVDDPGSAWDLKNTRPDLLLCPTDDAAVVAGVLDRADQILARGIALRPGETAQVAVSGSTAIMVMPPRLDALFAVARCIIHPFLSAIAGAEPNRARRRGPLTRKLSSNVGLTEVVLLHRAEQGVEPLGIGTLSLPALARAEYWFAVPPESEGHQAGDMVDAFDV